MLYLGEMHARPYFLNFGDPRHLCGIRGEFPIRSMVGMCIWGNLSGRNVSRSMSPKLGKKKVPSTTESSATSCERKWGGAKHKKTTPAVDPIVAQEETIELWLNLLFWEMSRFCPIYLLADLRRRSKRETVWKVLTNTLWPEKFIWPSGFAFTIWNASLLHNQESLSTGLSKWSLELLVVGNDLIEWWMNIVFLGGIALPHHQNKYLEVIGSVEFAAVEAVSTGNATVIPPASVEARWTSHHFCSAGCDTRR